MTQFEKAEIRRLPKKYRPMGAWGYFWHMFLYAIPVLGWICLIWGAVSDRNICRRSFARMYFAYYMVCLIVAVAMVVLMLAGVLNADMFSGLLENVNPGAGV